MVSSEIVEAYRAARDPRTDTRVLCHAPFVSLNFAQDGSATACCYNRKFRLGTYPAQRVSEIWTGARAVTLRQAFLDDEPAPGCDLCFHQLESRNYAGVLMRNFDTYSQSSGYQLDVAAPVPRALEFEISNTCNLECIMCNGYFSSAIRANREHLPALHSPYDVAFVEQLEEWLPAISVAKFLGGEPFLIEIYYEIWDRIARLNPDIRLSITTNATIVPERARQLLERLRANIVVSLDALSATTYETIRRNARFDQVMANVEYFLAYTRRRGTALSIAICPMTHNWRELPALLEFCESRMLPLSFNTVLRPPEASLRSLTAAELGEVIDCLAARRPEGNGWWTRQNANQWDGLVNQLRSWRSAKHAFSERCRTFDARVRRFAWRYPAASAGWKESNTLDRLLPPMISSLRVGRSMADRKQAVVQGSASPTPVALSENWNTSELLLVTHLLARFLVPKGSGTRRALDEATMMEEQQRLRDYLVQQEHCIGAIRNWMHERIQKGQADVLMLWVRELLGALAHPGHAQRRAHSSVALADGLATLRNTGVDDPTCRRIENYYGSLITALGGPSAWPGAGNGEATAGGTAVSIAADGPGRSGGDLYPLGEALCLFNRSHEPSADHAAFSRRIDGLLLAAHGAQNEELVCRALRSTDLAGVYRFLSYRDLVQRLTSWLRDPISNHDD